jgi:hypothetical protein
MCFKLEEPKNASYRADGSGDMISQRSTARQNLLVATAITRSVEQLTEQERRQLSAASLQARPNIKQRRQFARLRRELQQVRHDACN